MPRPDTSNNPLPVKNGVRARPHPAGHLLRDAGLVTVRRDAQRRWYELRPQPLAEVDAWLAPYRRLWSDRLDALERHLDSIPDQPTDQPR